MQYKTSSWTCRDLNSCRNQCCSSSLQVKVYSALVLLFQANVTECIVYHFLCLLFHTAPYLALSNACSHFDCFRNKVDQEREQDGICTPNCQGKDGLAETPAPSWLRWEWEPCTWQIQEKGFFEFSQYHPHVSKKASTIKARRSEFSQDPNLGKSGSKTKLPNSSEY